MTTIILEAPGPNLVFSGMPSGTTYESDSRSLIYTTTAADQVALMQAGCQTLTPFNAYSLPPFTAWKLGATACQVTTIPSLSSATNVNKSAMSVRSHFTTCQWSGAVILVYSNWSNWGNLGDYYDNGFQGYGTITGTCSIAYPTKSNIVGTGSFTVQPGQNAQVLVELNTVIPPGAQVFVSTYAVPASGCGVPVFQAPYYLNPGDTAANNWDLAAGEAAEYASGGITDKTAAPATVSNANPSTTWVWGPTAILAVQPVAQPVITVWGDSKAQNYKIETDAYGNLGPVPQAFGVNTPAICMGCSGKPASVDAGAGWSGTGYATAMSARLALCQLIGATHATADYGRNDAASSATAASIEASMVTIGSRLAGIGLAPWLVTQPPETTSTDSWATTTNQTRVAWQSVVDTLNTWERAIPAPYVGTIDVMAAVGTALTGGVWQPTWTTDGVHGDENAVPAIVGQVPLNKFNAVIPALALAYGDTYDRGLKNVQTALDFLLSPADLGHEILLGTLSGANFNSTADQAIGLTGPALYEVTSIVVEGASTSLSAAEGGFYSSTGKSGALLGTTTTTAYSGLTGSALALNIGGAGAISPVMSGNATIYLSLSTAQGAAATANVYAFGKRLAV